MEIRALNAFPQHAIAASVKKHTASVQRFVQKNWKVLSVLGVLIALFYWYEIRPVRIHRYCAVQASVDARNLLASKTRVTTDPARKASYQQLAAQNLYLRSDYESFYGKCLRHYAMPATQ